jgi:hypothetical protein
LGYRVSFATLVAEGALSLGLAGGMQEEMTSHFLLHSHPELKVKTFLLYEALH